MVFSNNIPIYLQVADDIKQRIVKGEILPGNRLPSTAELALAYKINPNTVQRIYRELELQGVCYTKRGVGTYIVDDENLTQNLKNNLVSNLIKDFLDGMHALGYSTEDIVNEIYKENRNAEV